MVDQKKKFTEIFNKGLENDDIAITWALSNVPCYKGRYKEIIKSKEILFGYKDMVDGYGFSSISLTSGLAWWGVIGGERVSELKMERYEMKEDYKRINEALNGLNEICGWQMGDFFNSLAIRVEYGVLNFLVNLCKISGIGKTHAFELYNMNIENLEDIKNNILKIEELENERLKDVVRKALRYEIS